MRHLNLSAIRGPVKHPATRKWQPNSWRTKVGTIGAVSDDTATVEASATDLALVTNPLALEQQVCFALAVASRNVIAAYRPLLEPMGLTHPQYLVMLALWQREPLKVNDLSRQLQLDPGTLSPLLKRLESAGYLRRERDPKDERALAVVLTRRGRELSAEAEKIPGEIVRRLGLPISELIDLQRRLQRLIAAATPPRNPE
jgi:DNA-binding MarR family transcriptional regulator